MPNILIFHGTGGHPQENWFPWLSQKLANANVSVTIPQFPTPEGQSLETWMKIFDTYKHFVTEKTILIGHSLGGLFLLRVLEQLDVKVAGAFFVAATVGLKPIKFYEADEKFSPGFDFNWDKIKSASNYFSVYHSDNDPYVSLGNGEYLAKQLTTHLHFIPGKGHFNASAGCLQFPQLLKEIKAL